MKEEWRREDYRITTEQSEFDLQVIHKFLVASYWAEGIPLDILEKSIENSLSFGLFHQNRQIGFARVITDYATFGYLGDVFVLEEFRGRGLAVWLMETIFAHPRLQGFRRWMLVTRDAHGLYSKFGFSVVDAPQKFMEKRKPYV